MNYEFRMWRIYLKRLFGIFECVSMQNIRFFFLYSNISSQAKKQTNEHHLRCAALNVGAHARAPSDSCIHKKDTTFWHIGNEMLSTFFIIVIIIRFIVTIFPENHCEPFFRSVGRFNFIFGGANALHQHTEWKTVSFCLLLPKM